MASFLLETKVRNKKGIRTGQDQDPLFKKIYLAVTTNQAFYILTKILKNCKLKKVNRFEGNRSIRGY